MKLPLIKDYQCNPAAQESVILTPGFAVIGVGSTQATIAWSATLTTEQQLTPSSVTFETSDATLATVDVNGNVTGIAPGVVFVGATYNGMTGYATFIVQPFVNGSYCSNEPVGTYIALDVSLSMTVPGFDQTFDTPLSVAKYLTKALANNLNITKDMMGVVAFDCDSNILLALSSDPPTIESAITGAIQQLADQDYTAMRKGLLMAIEQARYCQTCVRKVVVLVTDGQDDYSLEQLFGQALGFATTNAKALEEAAAFKSRGGIIIVVGLNATGNAYTLLRTIATPGYFVNVLPNQVQSAKGKLLGLPALYCAQEPPAYVPNYFPQDGGYVYDNLY